MSNLRRLKSFRGKSILKRKLMHMLVLQLDAEETAELRHEFKIVDTDNSGFIEKNELMEAI